MRAFAVLGVLVLASCASRGPVIDAKLKPLVGQQAAEVNTALCHTCRTSRDGRQMKCKVYLSAADPTNGDDGCGGRNTKVKLMMNADGTFSGMWEDID